MHSGKWRTRRKAGLFEHCYWLKHSRLGVTHLLSTGASKSRVVVGDSSFPRFWGLDNISRRLNTDAHGSKHG